VLDSIIKIIILNGIVLIIPGLNFSLVSRISMKQGLKFGLITTLGITLGVTVQVWLAMTGTYKILFSAPHLFKIIKWCGVLYILWIAITIARGLLKTVKPHYKIRIIESLSNCFLKGLAVDLLNPYIIVFYISLFSQIINENSNTFHFLLYSSVIFLIVFLWFLIVTIIFSLNQSRHFFKRNKKYIELASCFILFFFAIKLAWS
jgi:threonine/homoserine/homoserine lactone efflux protein